MCWLLHRCAQSELKSCPIQTIRPIGQILLQNAGRSSAVDAKSRWTHTGQTLDKVKQVILRVMFRSRGKQEC